MKTAGPALVLADNDGAEIAVPDVEGFLVNPLLTDQGEDLFPVLCAALAFAYISTVLLTRWICIQGPKRNYLLAMRGAMQATLDLSKADAMRLDPSSKARKDREIIYNAAQSLLSRSRDFVSEDRSLRSRFRHPFSLSTGHLAAWRLLHEAERQLQVDPHYRDKIAGSRALAVLAKLQDVPGISKALACELQNMMRDKASSASAAAAIQHVEETLFSMEDARMEMVEEARSKGFWLFWMATAAVLCIGLLLPLSSTILLAGATGGLLARLRKAVVQESRVFDFSVSWGVMFLTPPVGALTGWFGVALIEAGKGFELITGLFAKVALTHPNGLTFLIAFIFGLSATLFDRFAERLESDMQLRLDSDLQQHPKGDLLRPFGSIPDARRSDPDDVRNRSL